MPRKGNRTVYVANDQLWNRAKSLAGAEGLSAVITRLLADFIAQKSADEADYQKFHFEIFDVNSPEATNEVIGFEGRQLMWKTFNLIADPFGPSERPVKAVIQVYRTKLGTFVLLATPAHDDPESMSAFAHYESHKSIRDLMSGIILGYVFPPDRHELLEELTKSLGKDAVTWID